MLKTYKKNLILAIIFLFSFVIFYSFAIYSLAQENIAANNNSDNSNEDAYLINREIQNINEEIQSQKNRMQKNQDMQKQYAANIALKQKEKSSLNNQLAILDNRIVKAQLDAENVQMDIDKVKLEIFKTNLSIDEKNKEIEIEKSHIENILSMLNKQDHVDMLKALLLNNSLADFLSQVKYLEDINKELDDSVEQLAKVKIHLENEKSTLIDKSKKLSDLKIDLEEKQRKFEADKENKNYLIGQVHSSEKEYQKLLALAKQEQDESANEIASMEKIVRAKYAKLEKKNLEFNDSGLIWPVKKNVITAYFHDPEYPFKKIFEHPGVDIRAAQGSVVKAAASGYVAQAKDGGKRGYSYIMIIHGDELSTVYGHISQINVKNDDYVVQGQVIGLSGGMPGTHGAGSFTTGPHLHFEVRKNGIPVDPLSYLP
jgi:murein DD-endopeptidase MepM/ murein hydrolase activator NlpD